jgi:hypothetical protein
VAWAVLLPAHAGTGTIEMMFRDQLNVTTCKHTHTSYAAPGELLVVLAANPFHRVVSSAAWSKAITGGKVRLPHSNMSSEVAAFRGWCRDRFRGEPPYSIPQLATDMLGHRAPNFTIATAVLQADTLKLLTRLGYPPVTFQAHHCVSSCQTMEREVAHLPTAAFDQRELFDDACAAAVRRHYACDFAAFGFSPHVRDMLLPPRGAGRQRIRWV